MPYNDGAERRNVREGRQKELSNEYFQKALREKTVDELTCMNDSK